MLATGEPALGLGSKCWPFNGRETSVCLDRASQPGLALPQDVEAGWAPEKLELALTFLPCGTQVCKEQGTAILGMGWVEISPSMTWVPFNQHHCSPS